MTSKTTKELEAENAHKDKIIRRLIEDSMCDGYSAKRKEEYIRDTLKAAKEGVEKE